MKLHLLAIVCFGAWLAPFHLEACDHCGQHCDSCATAQSCCEGGGLLDRIVEAFSKRRAKSACDNTPSCGCEAKPISQAPIPSCGCESQEPECGCEVRSPDCGCEMQTPRYQFVPATPDCGCETAAPSCGCDICDSSGAKSSGGLLAKLFANKTKSTCEEIPTCDTTLACEVAPPSCGCESSTCASCDQPSMAMGYSCEPLLSRLFKSKKPSRAYSDCSEYASPGCDSDGLLSRLFAKKEACDYGCESAPACGCEMSVPDNCAGVPACGCESTCDAPTSGGLLSGFLAKMHGSSACGCDVTPSCGCETTPSCGCETSPSCGCQGSAGAYTTPMPVQVPRVPSQTQTVKPLQNHTLPSQDASIAPPAMRSVPAPAPPRATPNADANTDPFRDDAIDRVRKIPGRTIQYRKPQPTQSKPSPKRTYLQDFDPQARQGGIRVQYRDIATNIRTAESNVQTASYEAPIAVSNSKLRLNTIESTKANLSRSRR